MNLMNVQYDIMVKALLKSGKDIQASLTVSEANLVHLALGIAGEAGEVLDAIKKAAIYNKPLDRGNIIEELGDLEFYMEGLRQAIGVTREEVIDTNVQKLSVRYASGKYSDEQAQERADKV